MVGGVLHNIPDDGTFPRLTGSEEAVVETPQVWVLPHVYRIPGSVEVVGQFGPVDRCSGEACTKIEQCFPYSSWVMPVERVHGLDEYVTKGFSVVRFLQSRQVSCVFGFLVVETLL